MGEERDKEKMKGSRNEEWVLTRFLPTEESDYPIPSERYIAFERGATSFLCKQTFIDPNHITYFRVIICLCLLMFSSHLSYLQIMILTILGGLSDFFDGAYARSASKKTRLGIMLDPLADKFLVFTLLYILITRKALNPILVLLMVVMEGHLIVVPVLSWLYGLRRRKNYDAQAASVRRDRSAFILKSEAVLIGKVKFFLYACALLGILVGKALGSLFFLQVANWLLVLGIIAGALAFSSYVVRWLKHPYSFS
jgi:phosphatidylglycerophosphate synthase